MTSPAPAHLSFLTGGGEMGKLIAAFDWSRTPLGEIGGWPQSLKTAIALILRSPVPIVTLWGEAGVMIYNDGYSVFAGRRHPELLGSNVRVGWPEVADFNDNIMKVVHGRGETIAYKEMELALDRTGALEPAWMDLDYSPVLDEAGEPAGVIAIVIETTEKVKAERAAKASDAQFLTFAQAMPHHVWTSPPTGLLDWFNDRVYEYSGKTEVDLAGADWTEIVHPDDRDTAGAAWGQALATGGPYEVEFRIRRVDGAYRWHLVRAVPIRDADGNITRWIGTNTDIEEKRAAHEALANFAATLEAQVEQRTRERDRAWANSRDLQHVLGADGIFRAANAAWETILGWRPDEVVGRFHLDLVHPDDHPGSEGALEVASKDVLPTFENRLLHRDGSFRWFSWVAAPEDGLVYASGRHITAEKEAAQALEVAQEALRQSQKMEAVGQLTGGIAHDFNNLLQGITGSLDLVQKRITQGRTGELDRFITGAMTAASRAAALTHRLLAFSRRQPLDPRPVRANPLIASMEDLLRRTLGEHIELELVLAGGLWLTLCDPNQLENAVLNLAINARDAMPAGGKLTIETCNAHLDSAYAASQRDVTPGQYVCLCVTDTGSGMTADTIARAFEPFFTTKPIGQGTGLGLSMIYGFARQSEGYAKIYSEVGEGTAVKLYLPRHKGGTEEDDAPPRITAAHAADAGETVLVVEDEPVVRGLIVEVLSDLGYQALEAGDGPSGLAMLRSKRRIDLLITDIGLPGLNGRQVADAGRALRPALKVLFMTGYAENAALASGFLEPGMAMITKPFSMEALATRIRDILGND